MGILNPSVSEGETLPLRVLERAKDSTEVWHSQQVELARLSPAGKLITAEGSGHLIHLERPDLVAQAIREAIRKIRRGKWDAWIGQMISRLQGQLRRCPEKQPLAVTNKCDADTAKRLNIPG
jgi:hypothetical protein